MRRRRGRLAIFAATLVLGTGAAAYYATPYAARRYIEKEYPGVTVRTVRLRPDGARLALDVDRPGLRATLPDVWVSRDKCVTVTGGHVWLTLGDSGGAKAPEHKLTASGLTVEVKRADWTGTLEGAALAEDGTITVTHACGSGPDAKGSLHGIRKTPDGTITVARAEVTPARDLPLKPPFTLEGVTLGADRKKISAKTISADGQRADDVTVDLTDLDKLGTLRIQAASAVVQHAWANPVPVVFDRPVKILVAGGVITAEVGDAGISWFRGARTVDGVGTCEAWVNAFPLGLREPLEGFSFTGKVDFRVVYGDKPSLVLNGACRAKCDAPRIKALRGPFHYEVYTSKNLLVDRVAGPGSREWMPLPALGTTLPTAAITMEDPGFTYHRGFVVQAYLNSLIDNLKLGRFHRGGSTISMQLAKNLWLRRDKTLGRKAQEFFLAQALESCLTKDQILELYLNVVEFGPDLYGIGPAAEHYFKTSASALSPVQAFWLASILPRPRSAVPPDEATLARIKGLMGRFVNDGRIPEHYLTEVAPGDDSEWGQ